MLEEYSKSGHRAYDIKYHIIWVTKYRYKVLRNQVALRVRELIRQGWEAGGIVIVQISVASVTQESIRRYRENQGTTGNGVFKVEE